MPNERDLKEIARELLKYLEHYISELTDNECPPDGICKYSTIGAMCEECWNNYFDSIRKELES